MDEKSGGDGTGWQYNASEDAPVQQPVESDVPAQTGGKTPLEITWTASEFVAHSKPASWYLILAVVTLAVAAAVYFVGHDYIATGAIIVIGIIFGIIGSRKPRSLEYRLDDRGLTVAGKLYPYRHFKAFWLGRDGALESINLLPLKRFMPVMTIYFDPADEEKITGILGDYLPLGNHKTDPLDKFLKKIRF